MLFKEGLKMGNKLSKNLYLDDKKKLLIMPHELNSNGLIHRIENKDCQNGEVFKGKYETNKKIDVIVLVLKNTQKS